MYSSLIYIYLLPQYPTYIGGLFDVFSSTVAKKKKTFIDPTVGKFVEKEGADLFKL